jgi:hypothetical protein
MAKQKGGDASENGAGPGRTPIGKQVNVRLYPATLADLEHLAAVNGVDLSTIIRIILARYRDLYYRELSAHDAPSSERGSS